MVKSESFCTRFDEKWKWFVSDSLRPCIVHGILQARILEWVGSLSLLQGIFPTQESNQDLLHCRQILYQVSYQGKLWESMTGQQGWAKHGKLGGLPRPAHLDCPLHPSISEMRMLPPFRCREGASHNRVLWSASGEEEGVRVLRVLSMTFFRDERRSERPSSMCQFSNSFRLKYTTQRDGMGREEGGGFRMGNTCIPVADSFWYLAKLIQLCKV